MADITRRRFVGGLAAIGAFFAAKGVSAAGDLPAVEPPIDSAMLARADRKLQGQQWNYAMGQVMRERGRLDPEFANLMNTIERDWRDGWRKAHDVRQTGHDGDLADSRSDRDPVRREETA